MKEHICQKCGAMNHRPQFQERIIRQMDLGLVFLHQRKLKETFWTCSDCRTDHPVFTTPMGMKKKLLIKSAITSIKNIVKSKMGKVQREQQEESENQNHEPRFQEVERLSVTMTQEDEALKQ